MLKIDKKSYKNIGIYNIAYITIQKIDNCKNIHSANPQYFIIANASGYIEEKDVNTYLFFDSADENKGLLKKCNDVWGGIKNEMKTINGGIENEYEKDYMKTKFNPDDDLLLNKPLKFYNMTVTIRSVFEDLKIYPQVFLDDTLCELLI